MTVVRSSSSRFRMLFLGVCVLLGPVLPHIHALQADDEVTPEVQSLYTQAHAAKQQGDSAKAIELYRQIIRRAPHLAAAYNNLGMLYFDNHEYQHAVETLRHGMELDPKMPSAAAMLGMSYYQLGNAEKALPLLQAALRANPRDSQVEMVLVHVLLNVNQLQDAESRLNDYLARNPKDQEAWYLLGKTHLRLSEEALKKVNEIDSDSVVAHEISGEIDESMHNYDLALVEYKKAIDKAPQQPGTHMHMADVFWNLGKWQSAEGEFRAELLNDPNSCLARWKLANSMLEANDPTEEAKGELDKAIDRCPNLMQARVDRARALVRLGKQSDALPDLMMALKESPREPSIHFLLAAVYRSEGKTTEAQAEMRTYGTLQREASAAIASQASDASAIKNNAH